MKAIRTIKTKDGQAMLCPYFNEHYGGCLSADMHGMTLASVVEHCGSRYAACTVYRKFDELSTVADYAGPVQAVAFVTVDDRDDENARESPMLVCRVSHRCFS
ncbi:MAG TPA: hypothetical protein VLH56_10945 [Dissulfurispiraceae bacterium]|nr:hypothetical protein [Dissulfurispiraceae bacterium]